MYIDIFQYESTYGAFKTIVLFLIEKADKGLSAGSSREDLGVVATWGDPEGGGCLSA